MSVLDDLRQFMEAYPEDIWPTPPPELQAKDAAAAHVMRRVALPQIERAIAEIEDAESQRDQWRADAMAIRAAMVKIQSRLDAEYQATVRDYPHGESVAERGRRACLAERAVTLLHAKAIVWEYYT